VSMKDRIRSQQAVTEAHADLLKAVANPVRLCLVHQLATYGPRSVTFFTDCMNSSQSSISQHLSKLRAAGIVEAERDGQSMVYRLIDDRIRQVLDVLWNNEEKSL
jgi:DNA-binding transcriptional ArsR family regulator